MRSASKAERRLRTVMVKRRLPLQPFALRWAEAAAMYDVSQSTFREWVADGRVHPPYYVSPRVQLFDVEQLREDWERLKAEKSPEPLANPWDEVLDK
jgi:hypothetical protein